MTFSTKGIMEWFQLLDFHSSRVTFYRDWAKSMEAGELLANFLKAELEISSAKQTRDSSRAFALRQMLRRIHQGEETLPSQIVGLSMPANDRMMLAAGDSAGQKDLIQVLRDLCTALEEQTEAKKIIFKALLTPLVLLPGMVVFAYVLSSKSIPIIEKIAPPEVWTPFNNTVRVTANAIHHGGPYLALAIAALGGLLWMALSRWTGRTRLKMERVRPDIALLATPVMPWLLPLSMYRDFQAVMILSSMSVLLKSGKTLTESIELIATRGTPYIRFHMQRILNFIDEYPLEVSSAFSSGIMSPKVAARLATISRTNNSYEEVLIEVGTTGAAEVRNQVQVTAIKINVILLGASALLMVFLYMGQMSITSTMKSEMDPTKIKQRKMERAQQM